MPLVTADVPTREHIMDGTYPIWGEGLSREAYSRWNQGQMETAWGRGHLRRVALVEEGRVLASAKRYDFEGRLLGQPVGVLGIGAVFTPPEQRGRGHAASLIDAMTAEAEARGCCHGAALLRDRRALLRVARVSRAAARADDDRGQAVHRLAGDARAIGRGRRICR